jgi:hypothetical protein
MVAHAGLSFASIRIFSVNFGFLFVDIQGNILFVPEIRELIHRNDLVIGHAHIAMGIGIAFMALAIMQRILPSVFTKAYAIGWASLVSLMVGALSVAGLIEAGWVEGDVQLLWILRVLFAILILMIDTLPASTCQFESELDRWYHLIGFLRILRRAAFASIGSTSFRHWASILAVRTSTSYLPL